MVAEDYNDKIRRCAQLTACILEHRRMTDALQRIRDGHAVGRFADEPGFVALVGESRSGKSTIKNQLVREFNTERRRAVEFTLTEKIEPRGVLQRYLWSMGDLVAKGTVPELMRKAEDATAAEGVEIVFIDEAQHLRREDAKVNYQRANLVKTLLDAARVPFVLIGTPDLDGLIGGNDQVKNRMIDRIELDPFSRKDGPDWLEYRGILHRWDEALPFPEWCFLRKKPVALALHAATGGYIGRVSRLTRFAGKEAIMDGSSRIEVKHWIRAWERLEAEYATDRTNPFKGLVLPPPEPKPVDPPMPSAA